MTRQTLRMRIFAGPNGSGKSTIINEAAQLSYQTYFFDNSRDGENFRLFAHFKKLREIKKWDKIDKSIIPRWFVKYYSEKIK